MRLGFIAVFCTLFCISHVTFADTFDLSEPLTMIDTYEKTLEIIKGGDTIVFKHDGRTVEFHIKMPIGHGGTTMLYLLENGKVLRINVLPYGDYLESHLTGQRAFAKAGVPVVNIFESESHVPMYLVTEFINFKSENVDLTLSKFLPLLEKGFDSDALSKAGVTVDLAKHMVERLEGFVRKLAPFIDDQDFRDTNIAFVPSRDEWVIFDFMGEPKVLDRAAKGVQPTLINIASWNDYKLNQVHKRLLKLVYEERYKQFPEVAGCHNLELL